jgi:hypothetical protein
MTDLTPEALDALQERLRRIEWGVTGEPCAAGNVDETAALEADTAITALRAQLATARPDAMREAAEAANEANSLELALHGPAKIVERILALIDTPTPSAPSPEAVARAALQWVAWHLEMEAKTYGAHGYSFAEVALCAEAGRIRHRAKDPAALAAIIAKAGDAAP